MRSTFLRKNILGFFVALALCISLPGCVIFQGKSTPPAYAQDTGITTSIKARFIQSDLISAPNIHVETQNGVVQLTGFVSSYAQIREAQRIAQSTQGVKYVINSLVVQHPHEYR